MTALVQVFWDLLGLDQFSKWCDYSAEGQKKYLFNCADHHKTSDFVTIIHQTLCREIAAEFMKVWKIENETKAPVYADLVKFMESSLVQNVNLLRHFEIVDGPLMSLFLMRAGMRTGNGQLYYSGLEYASLFTFANGHKNYQLIKTFELYLIRVAPPEVQNFIFTFLFKENKTHQYSDSCSEGLDYRLEEFNKKFCQGTKSRL